MGVRTITVATHNSCHPQQLAPETRSRPPRSLNEQSHLHPEDVTSTPSAWASLEDGEEDPANGAVCRVRVPGSMVYPGSFFSAASNDLKLYSRIQKFSKVNKKVSCSTAQVINRHTWYLTEDLVLLAVFDESLSLETRNNIAKKISQLPSVLPENLLFPPSPRNPP